MKKPRLTDVPGHQSHMVHCPVWEKRRRWHWPRGGEGLGLGGSELAHGHMGPVCKSPCSGSSASPGSSRTGATQKPLGQSRWGPEPPGGREPCPQHGYMIFSCPGRPGWVVEASAWRAGHGWRGAEPAAGGAVPGLRAGVAATGGSWRERAQRR